MPANTMDLTGMPIDDAMALAKHQFDREFALELEDEKARMVEDGLDLNTVNGLIDHRIAHFISWRNDRLDELRARLLARAGRLH